MREPKKFLGMETSSLPAVGLILALAVIFISLSILTNSNINRSINRLDSKLTEIGIELEADIRDLREDDVELKREVSQ